MTYRTKAAHDLIDKLHTRDSWLIQRRAKAEHDVYERGLYDGWRASLALVIENLEEALPKIENEAELVPPPDAEQWLETQMAGDWRDFPDAA